MLAYAGAREKLEISSCRRCLPLLLHLILTDRTAARASGGGGGYGGGDGAVGANCRESCENDHYYDYGLEYVRTTYSSTLSLLRTIRGLEQERGAREAVETRAVGLT